MKENEGKQNAVTVSVGNDSSANLNTSVESKTLGKSEGDDPTNLDSNANLTTSVESKSAEKWERDEMNFESDATFNASVEVTVNVSSGDLLLFIYL